MSNDDATLGRAGGYDLLVELATGGMATVYLGRQSAGGSRAPLVAIKRPHKHLAKDNTYLAMLLDEARLASAIDHPNVVKVRELGFEGGEPFIVMDYVEGASLADLRKALVARERAVDPRVAVRVVLDALAGLQAAHVLHDEHGRHLGIIHRDVSPHNVLVGCDGQARLTDFGIAKAADRVQVTRTHEVKGKIAYLAPERVDKRRICTIQSDVFAMAVVLWECIAGRRLFRGDEALDILQEVLNAEIPSLRRVGAPIPPALDEVIQRGLARDLSVRYRSAAELASAIEKAAGRGGVASHAEVARVVDTVFDGKLRLVHERLRAASAAAGHPEADLGLVLRPPLPPDARSLAESELAELAPPLPSARYTFGHNVSEMPAAMGVGRKLPRRAAVALGAVALLGVSVLATAAVKSALSGPPAPAAAPTEPAPVVVASAAPKVHEVTVPLPFLASRVMLDDTERTLRPASDHATFWIANGGGPRHRVVAVALDGTRAEAVVIEVDGVARVDGDGYKLDETDVTIELPDPTTAASVASAPKAPARKPSRPRARP
ncbi:MAG: serine/threonine protein kinase [Myxococcales bacterium]|nr:serine/threonine protein kinase [Myxococcales bacterium]